MNAYKYLLIVQETTLHPVILSYKTAKERNDEYIKIKGEGKLNIGIYLKEIIINKITKANIVS